MADIVIRGMEMPKTCGDCPLSALRMDCKLTGKDISHDWMKRKIPGWCPLVPLQEGHGRLGDLDALEDAFIRYYLNQERSNHLVFTPVEIKQHFADMIGDWPTIVPAEGGGEE